MENLYCVIADLMDVCVRAFVFDDEDNLLLVKHAKDELWVLPGGHIEANENMYDALEREVHEELGLDITILGSENSFKDRNVAAYPLPISIHTVKYEHRTKGNTQRLEIIFFARAQGIISEEKKDEIYDHQWLSQEDFLALDENVETWRWMQEVLEQNQELLELL